MDVHDDDTSSDSHVIASEVGSSDTHDGDSGSSQQTTSQDLIKCSVCDKKYGSRGGLQRHMRLHTNIYPFTCAECSKGFHAKTTMDDHKRTHHGARKFVCPCCSVRICTKQGRKRHYAQHKETCHQCDVCNKTFTTLEYLKRHRLSHNKMFICGECGKSFTMGHHLKEHMVSHTGVRFSCDIKDCTFKTAYKQSLVRHRATHLATPLLVCSACGRGFKRQEGLQKHEKTCSGIPDVWSME